MTTMTFDGTRSLIAEAFPGLAVSVLVLSLIHI